MRNYIALTKPRITWLILMSAAVGYFFGWNGSWNLAQLLHTIIGTGLIASGTAALNQWWEHRADAKMTRTEGRPIPAGLITPSRAIAFGIALCVIGTLELWFRVNPLTALLGLFTIVTYLFIYTPLKSRTPHSTTIGAVPGAMPPLIGFAAASGTLNWQAAALFAILFLWQFPHFYAIAWMYREDYARGGIRMLPVVEPDGESTARRILLFSVLLLPVSLLPSFLAMSGKFYLIVAIALGLWFLRASFQVTRERTVARARAVLIASVMYLPMLYGLMLIDRTSL